MKFSITVPAYKSCFLYDCIHSVLAQTYQDFELIIVNDASPENLDAVISKFHDSRIRYYINTKNCGAVNVVDNWNICLNYAKGDYIICMGDDDLLLPNCLEEFDRLITAFPGLGVYHAWTQIINEKSQVIRMQEARPIRESVYSMMWHRMHGRIQFIGDFLFDTELLKKHGGFFKMPLAWGSDDISAYIAAVESGIANMQVPGFQYRVNTQTISHTGNVSIKMKAIEQEEGWYNEFLAKEINSQNNPVTHIFWKMLKSEISKDMMKKRIFIVGCDIKAHGPGRLFHWLRYKNVYRLNVKMIGYAYIEALKNEIQNGEHM